ncbi:MAG: hypothetical protein RLZZ305_1315 [Actinomycetota bacterium]|jgi:glycosyltransferase involved in cell wall biosynthesis
MKTAPTHTTSAPDPRDLHPSQHQVSVGILSTYPPTQCGLATFASALANGLRRCGVTEVGVVACGDDESVNSAPGVVGRLVPRDALSVSRAAQILNRYDVVVVQHEYGIFGGEDGDEVLEVMKRLQRPVITTLHTVPLQPSTHQRRVLESVVANSDAAVTMTAIARQRLLASYAVDSSRVVTVPHGATIPNPVAPTSDSSPLVLTWGLLGPGKGIEWVIDALALLRDEVPVRYVVAGQTHPKVRATDGENYRHMLERKVRKHGLENLVTFDAEYRTLGSLMRLVSRASCVVLPYESIDQITSGVLVDAVAAGRPVIATAFPHAIELLSDGAGILVPPRNAEAIARAVRRVATDQVALRSMAARAAALAPMHNWVSVANSYRNLGLSLLPRRGSEALA